LEGGVAVFFAQQYTRVFDMTVATFLSAANNNKNDKSFIL
jgi:hypothetical protein